MQARLARMWSYGGLTQPPFALALVLYGMLALASPVFRVPGPERRPSAGWCDTCKQKVTLLGDHYTCYSEPCGGHWCDAVGDFVSKRPSPK